MDRHRVEQAVRRIEVALGRIEAAADAFAPNSGAATRLANNHHALREEVAATLRDLDELIEGLNP